MSRDAVISLVAVLEGSKRDAIFIDGADSAHTVSRRNMAISTSHLVNYLFPVKVTFECMMTEKPGHMLHFCSTYISIIISGQPIQS